MTRWIASILAAFALMMGAAAAPAADHLLWFADGHLTAQAARLLDAMREAESFGLRSADYALDMPPSEIASVLAGHADAATRRRFDVAMSKTAARLVSDLHSGRIDPRSVGFYLPTAAAANFPVDDAVRKLASSANVAKTLEACEPRPAPYKRLEAALANYRKLSRELGSIRLPTLPARSLRPGSEYAGAPQLRRLLQAFGDLAARDAQVNEASLTIDSALVAAIRRFQSRHGLDADGIIGARTFAALTTPLEQRVRQIELSMERWRWLSAIERPNIVVNIPQFVLIALPPEQGDAGEPLEMRAIVGQDYAHTRTPVFTSAITQVVFQPYWDVPASILRREILPQLRRNPAYLDRHQMEIVQGASDDARVVAPTPDAIRRLAAGELRLRQRPGPSNALGPVKFVMPNPFNVYLHATPEQALFGHSRRTFSHGCVRVSEPAALAEYVLRDAPGNWNAEAVEAAMCGTETLRIRLLKPVPVVVFYSTAVATRSEGVLFFEDVYGHDRKLQQLLSRRRP